VDRQNPQRLMHCIEVSLTTGQAYSGFRQASHRQRPFRIVKVGLERPREELYARINARVNKMVDEGLVEEARSVLPYRHCNSLNTVGYKEMFRYLDGEWSLDRAIEMIQQNSRHYAKRQITWLRADNEIQWQQLTANNIEKTVDYVISGLHL